jgi:hypothetical protein
MNGQSKKEMFKISFENTDVEIDMKTGKAKSFLSLKHPSSVRP